MKNTLKYGFLAVAPLLINTPQAQACLFGKGYPLVERPAAEVLQSQRTTIFNNNVIRDISAQGEKTETPKVRVRCPGSIITSFIPNAKAPEVGEAFSVALKPGNKNATYKCEDLTNANPYGLNLTIRREQNGFKLSYSAPLSSTLDTPLKDGACHTLKWQPVF